MMSYILNFFLGKEYSLTSKFIGLLSFILVLLLVDNLLGFSFYYSNNQKLNQIKIVEMLKKDCKDNEEVLIALNDTEKRIIYRKNIIEIFLDLFTSQPLDSKNITEVALVEQKNKFPIEKPKISSIDTIKCNDDSLSLSPKITLDTLTTIDTISFTHQDSQLKAKEDSTYEGTILKEKTIDKPNKTRSKLWHTLSSSYFLIILMIVVLFVPFTEKQMNWSTFLGVIVFMIFIAGLLWLNQYLLGLIPLILGKPWINYMLNIVIHSITLSLIGSAVNKKNN